MKYGEESFDDEDGLEYKQLVGKNSKKPDMAILNKRYVTQDEMDELFLGE